MKQPWKLTTGPIFFWVFIYTSLIAESNAKLPPLTDIASLLTIHDHYCPASPRCPIGSTDYRESPAFLNSCCGDCFCDIETCAANATCCPSTLDHLPTAGELKARQEVSCEPAHLRSPLPPIPTGYHFKMSRNCADDFDHSDIVVKCENSTDLQPLTLDMLLPVTDNKTRLTYRNRFCAECNRVTEEHLITWDPAVECSIGGSLLVTMETVIDKVLLSPSCNLVYKPGQAGNKVHGCEPAVGECNVTGHWGTYDAYIERACLAYEVQFRNKRDDTLYRNVFCYLCNEPLTPKRRCPDNNARLPIVVVKNNAVSFSAILKLTSVAKRPIDDSAQGRDNVLNKCQDSEILDPLKGTCRALWCLPPKELVDGTCKDTYFYLKGVSYDAFIKVTLSKPVSISALSETVEELELILGIDASGVLRPVITLFSLFYSPVMNLENNEQHAELADYLVAHLRPDVEENVLYFLNTMLGLDGRNVTLMANTDLQAHLELDVYKETGGLSSIETLQTRDGDNLALYRTVSSKLNVLKINTITKTHGCPLVDISHYRSDYLPNGDLFVTELDFVFPANALIGIGNETVSVCKEDFLYLAEKQMPPKRVYTKQLLIDHSRALGILSLILAILSLICLALTLLTYSLFKELQTQPGVNNMCLVGSLIMAQSLYQFGAGQAGKIGELACQIVGILIHFFWLMSIFWMNVCSFHMFRVFSLLKTISRRGNVMRRTVLYTMYCFLSSAVLVAINIVVSSTRSRGAELGYGGSLCYVSDYFMNLYTFVIPIGLVVLVNLCLFIAVIVTVKRLPTMAQGTQTSRNYMKLYAKLSCVTGGSWLFGFLVFTGVVVFEYLFIICNAGQGVYIFISFVCNARVRELYRALLFKRKEEQERNYSKRHSRSTTLTSQGHI